MSNELSCVQQKQLKKSKNFDENPHRSAADFYQDSVTWFWPWSREHCSRLSCRYWGLEWWLLLRTPQQRLLDAFQWSGLNHSQNCRLLLEMSTPYNTQFFEPTWVSPSPKRHLDRFSHFCRAHPCGQHRQTDHATCDIYAVHAMRSNNNGPPVVLQTRAICSGQSTLGDSVTSVAAWFTPVLPRIHRRHTFD